MSLLRDTALSGLGVLVSTGSRFLVTVMLIRLMPPSHYGSFLLAQWVVDLLVLLLTFGLPGVITRFLPSISLHSDWTSTAVAKLLFSAILAANALIVAVFLAYLALTDHSPRDTASLLYFAAGYCTATSIGPILQGSLRFGAIIAGHITFAIAAPLLIVALLPSSGLAAPAIALGSAWLLSATASLSFAYLVPKPSSGQASTPAFEMRSVVRYAANVWIVGLITSLVWSRGELGVLSLSVDSYQVAIYGAALSLIGIVSQGAALLTGGTAPHLTRMIHQGEHQTANTAMRALTLAVLIATVVMSLSLSSLGFLLVPALLGNNYARALETLNILSISAVSVSYGCSYVILQIYSNGRAGLQANVLALAILLVTSAVFSPYFGIAGAAWARVIAQLVFAFTVLRQLGQLPEFRRTSHAILCALGTAVVGLLGFYVFHTVFRPPAVANICVAALTAGLLCISIKRIMSVSFKTLLNLRR